MPTLFPCLPLPPYSWIGYGWFPYTRSDGKRVIRTNSTGSDLRLRFTQTSQILVNFNTDWHGEFLTGALNQLGLNLEEHELNPLAVSDLIDNGYLQTRVYEIGSDIDTALGGRHGAGDAGWVIRQVPTDGPLVLARGLDPTKEYRAEIRVIGVSGPSITIADNLNQFLTGDEPDDVKEFWFRTIERWRVNEGTQGAGVEFEGWVMDYGGKAVRETATTSPLLYAIYGDSVLDSTVFEPHDSPSQMAGDGFTVNYKGWGATWGKKAIDRAAMVLSTKNWDSIAGVNNSFGGWVGAKIADGSNADQTPSMYPLNLKAFGTLMHPDVPAPYNVADRAQFMNAIPWGFPFFGEMHNRSMPSSPPWVDDGTTATGDMPHVRLIIYALGLNDQGVALKPTSDPDGYRRDIWDNIQQLRGEFPCAKILVTLPVRLRSLTVDAAGNAVVPGGNAVDIAVRGALADVTNFTAAPEFAAQFTPTGGGAALDESTDADLAVVDLHALMLANVADPILQANYAAATHFGEDLHDILGVAVAPTITDLIDNGTVTVCDGVVNLWDDAAVSLWDDTLVWTD